MDLILHSELELYTPRKIHPISLMRRSRVNRPYDPGRLAYRDHPPHTHLVAEPVGVLEDGQLEEHRHANGETLEAVGAPEALVERFDIEPFPDFSAK